MTTEVHPQYRHRLVIQVAIEKTVLTSFFSESAKETGPTISPTRLMIAPVVDHEWTLDELTALLKRIEETL